MAFSVVISAAVGIETVVKTKLRHFIIFYAKKKIYQDFMEYIDSLVQRFLRPPAILKAEKALGPGNGVRILLREWISTFFIFGANFLVFYAFLKTVQRACILKLELIASLPVRMPS